MKNYTLIQGNCLEVMPTLADNSIDSIVCDPPYELGFMGKSWDKSGIAYNVEVWREALRVLKPGGHLLAFGGSRTYHRLAVAIEDAGFEIRDQIQWIYGQGFPKSLNIGNGFGTALKPAHEPICLARKPIEKGLTIAQNVLKWGTGAINIDATRITHDGEDTRRNAKGGDNGMQGTQTFKIRERFAVDQPIQQGRFPANVIHDGSDEVEAEFAKYGESKSTKSFGRNGNNVQGITGMVAPRLIDLERGHSDSGTPSRFFYCAKTSKADRNEGCDDLPLKQSGGMQGTFDQTLLTGSGNIRTNIARNHHPTVKPTDLMRYLCRLITPPNGTILDPFLGSGSTGKAAIIEGFNFIGIELDEHYFKVAEARIKRANLEPCEIPQRQNNAKHLPLFAI